MPPVKDIKKYISQSELWSNFKHGMFQTQECNSHLEFTGLKSAWGAQSLYSKKASDLQRETAVKRKKKIKFDRSDSDEMARISLAIVFLQQQQLNISTFLFSRHCLPQRAVCSYGTIFFSVSVLVQSCTYTSRSNAWREREREKEKMRKMTQQHFRDIEFLCTGFSWSRG